MLSSASAIAHNVSAATAPIAAMPIASIRTVKAAWKTGRPRGWKRWISVRRSRSNCGAGDHVHGSLIKSGHLGRKTLHWRPNLAALRERTDLSHRDDPDDDDDGQHESTD